MVSKVIEEIFSKNFSGIIHRYQDKFLADESMSNPNVLLLSIYIIDKKNKESGARDNEVKELFISLGRNESNFLVAVTRAKQRKWVKYENGQFSLLIGGVKKIREVLGQVEKLPIYLIKSGENFGAIKLLEEFLYKEIMGDEISLCDSHISHSTLFPFAVLKGKIKSIKILTSNVYDSAKMKAYTKKMKKEMGISIEIKNNKKIHDRFLICGDKCWAIGSSIKDLGNKDTVIREISEVASSMKDLFSERWDESCDI